MVRSQDGGEEETARTAEKMRASRTAEMIVIEEDEHDSQPLEDDAQE